MVTKSILAKAKGNLFTETGKSRWALMDVNARLWMASFLVVSDLISMLLAVLLAMQIRQLPWLIVTPAYRQIFLMLAIVLVFAFSRKGLYPGVGMHYVDELQYIVSNTSFAFIFMIGVTFILQTTIIYSRLILFLSWAFSLAFIPVGRYLVRSLLVRLELWGEPVVIVGETEKALALAKYFKNNLHFGIRPMAVFPDEFSATDQENPSIVSQTSKIKEYANKLSLKTVLVVVDDLNGLDNEVDRYRFVFQRVILIKDQNGKFGLNNLAPLDFADVLGLQVKNNLLSFSSQVTKRTIDVVASFFGLMLLSPVFGLIALAIKVVSPGRVFYRQKRLGKNGKEFTLLKFRTMHLNADRVLRAELDRNPALKKEWDQFQKLKNDPRITRVGGFLRKFSLDELPQLWNVARGEMSLVGPRPIMMDQREMYGQKIKEYVQVRPGITGLWQVSGRNGTSFTRRAELDDEYIQRWSIWLDVYILLKTAQVVLWRDGAY
jgi:Undecaprenyl-phosphate galactose phosphotransferase WbaP